MNHEAKVIALRRLTNEVRSEIVQVQAKGGIDPNSVAYAQMMSKIAGWETRLKRFQQIVKNDMHFAHVRNAGGGRGASFQQRQRVSSAAQNAAGLRGQMAATAKAIAELIAAMAPDSVAIKRAIEAIEKLLKELGDDLSLNPTQDLELIEIVRQNEPEGPNPNGTPPGMSGINLLTLCLALFAIIKSRRK